MKIKKERLLTNVYRYQNRAMFIMSIIVSYHIFKPKGIGGIVMTVIAFLFILYLSYKLLERVENHI